MTVNPPRLSVYAAVPRLWPESTVVCLGGGSSLTPEDVDYCRGKAKVIAIKEAVRLAPWADVLYACDAKWWRWEEGAPSYQGVKYALEPQPTPYPGVQVLRDAGPEGLSDDPSALCTGNNSGYQAINLAVHLGATKIVLLGYDMSVGPDGQQNWFGEHPCHVRSPYPFFLTRFASIAAPLQARGVTVLNASRFTVMNTFPRVPLAEALG